MGSSERSPQFSGPPVPTITELKQSMKSMFVGVCIAVSHPLHQNREGWERGKKVRDW